MLPSDRFGAAYSVERCGHNPSSIASAFATRIERSTLWVLEFLSARDPERCRGTRLDSNKYSIFGRIASELLSKALEPMLETSRESCRE